MAARSRQGALTAGVILIIIGLLFLLENWYDAFFWHLVTKFWPVILILIGLKKLYAHFTWRAVPPVPASEPKE